MAEAENPTPEDRGSATPGCCILSSIITVFGGLILLYVTVYFIQNKKISTFTSDQPAQVQVMDPTREQIDQLQVKLLQIKSATDQGRKERILLSADDLNTLIATEDILADFRGTTFIERISDRGIEVRMTQPMRKIPLSPDQRHLNAKFIFEPELRKRTIAFRLRDIIPDKGSIPPQFIKSYDAIGFFRIDPDNEVIKQHVPRLSRVYSENGHVIVETGRPAPDQTPLN